LEHGYIGFDKLKQFAEAALDHTPELNIDRSLMLARLALVQERLGL